MRQLPHLNEMHENFGSKGLHVLSLYAQLHPISQVATFISDHKIKYPVALNYDGSTYSCSVLPHVWIVGVDGKIIFSGSKGYEKVLETELAKVKRPGLGKVEVAAELEPAAKAYLEGKYAEAHKLAAEIANKAEISDGVLADAEHLLERIDSRVKLLVNRADAAEVQGDYAVAMRALEELATDFKGMEDAEDAPARLAKMKADKQVAREMEAFMAYNELDRKLANAQAELSEWAAEYGKFAEQYKSTKAGARAIDTAAGFKAAAEEEAAAKEPMKNPAGTPPEKKPAENAPEKTPEKAPSK
ncbi:MAG: hypothetical protein IT462_15405 [Planctomycetes bacterium]|nr:hypothetical protein [Planctomycetota bacterium]